MVPAHTRGVRRRANPPYTRVTNLRAVARKRGDWDEVERQRKLLRDFASKDPMDPNYRRLKYVRYADDFLLGFAGPKDEAEEIKRKIGDFLRDELRLTLSGEKTLVTHAGSSRAKFLGYEIGVTKNADRRGANQAVFLAVPKDVVLRQRKELFRRGKPCSNYAMVNDTDYTIVSRYQSRLRGLYNYYSLAFDVSRRMWEVKRVLELSLVATLANKHKISSAKLFRKMKVRNEKRPCSLAVRHRTASGKVLTAEFGGFSMTRKRWGAGPGPSDPDLHKLWHRGSGPRSELVDHLVHDRCSLCGAEGPVQMHHVRALADLGKVGGGSPKWKVHMSVRRRKAIPVCERCHRDIHGGKYDGPRLRGKLESRVLGN